MSTRDRETAPGQPTGPARAATVDDVRALTCKRLNAWWTVLLVDPVAVRLVHWTDRHTRITSDQVTWVSTLAGLGAAGRFARGDRGSLLAGARLYHLSFVLDCVDGIGPPPRQRHALRQLARLCPGPGPRGLLHRRADGRRAGAPA
ncbi:hypothetical protein GCM10009665_42310 [Kitasatospora nipponensis]|uniref:Uncharacterized protein n=1 Tax=Kitasatospora nipponensis TaxID=258049 RepID=A0ABN1WGG7_9ACTN